MQFLLFLKSLQLEEVVIVCVVMIFAIIFVPNSSNVFSQVGFTLYNNTEFGIQLLYPQNWIAVEGDPDPGDFQTDIVRFEPLGEEGKHFTRKVGCGEVCLLVIINNDLNVEGLSLQQYSDTSYNDVKNLKNNKAFKLLEYNSHFKLGDKKAFEILFQMKQGNRDYVERFIGTNYGEKNFIYLQFKSRTKFSDQMLPLGQTMIDSFRFADTKIPLAPLKRD